MRFPHLRHFNFGENDLYPSGEMHSGKAHSDTRECSVLIAVVRAEVLIMPKPSRRDASKEVQWRERNVLQRLSGLSVKAFCEREGIKENLFFAWKREIKLRDEEVSKKYRARRGAAARMTNETVESVSFVPVSLIGQPEAVQEPSQLVASPVPAAVIEVISPCGFLIRVPAHVDPGALRLVLIALKRSAC